jgi:hypothetical protein
MGLDVGAIGAAAGGFGQGLNQGFDLVNKYQQIQEQRDQQRKRQEVEAVGAQIAKEGLFQSDPDKALGLMRDAYVKIGDLENANKFQQNLVANQQAAEKKLAFEAWEYMDLDPAESLTRINKLNTKRGINSQYNYVSNPDGTITVNGTKQGKQFAQNYANAMEFKSDFGEQIMGFVLSPEERIKYEQEERSQDLEEKNVQSAIDTRAGGLAVDQGRLALEQELQPAKLATERAQAESATATAGARVAESKAAIAKAPFEQRELEARTANLEYTRNTAAVQDTMEYIKNNLPEGLPDETGNLPADSDPTLVGRLSVAMQDGSGTDIPSATDRARDILRQRKQITGVDPQAGTVTINGKRIPIGPNAVKELLQLNKAPTAAPAP